jgi:hypothetical protein
VAGEGGSLARTAVDVRKRGISEKNKIRIIERFVVPIKRNLHNVLCRDSRPRLSVERSSTAFLRG